MADEVITPAVPDAELTDPAEIKAARAAFLHDAPPILSSDEPPAAPDPVAEEAAAIAELTTPPTPEGAAAAPAEPPAPGTPDAYAEFGGRAEVEQAFAIQEALRTESGLRLLVAQGLRALNYDADAIQAALDGAVAPPAPTDVPPAPPDPLATILDGLEDDEGVSVGDVKRIVAYAVAEAARQATAAATTTTQAALDPVRQEYEQQRAAVAGATTDSTLVELLGPQPTDPAELADYNTLAAGVKHRAGAYLDPNDWTAVGIRNALVRGHADLVSQKQAELQAYLRTKREKANGTPVATGGSAGGEGLPPEPRNIKEAIAARKAAGIQ
jgi:hypothetical protein